MVSLASKFAQVIHCMEIVAAVLGFVQLVSEYGLWETEALTCSSRTCIPSMYLLFLVLPSEKVECLSAKLPCGYFMASLWVTFGGI